MSDFLERTRLLFGTNVERLLEASVAVFGLGGVGAFAAEALARSGVGRIVLIDGDVVSDSNRNRQLVALCSTIGRAKVDVMAERIVDIHPRCKVERRQHFYLPHETSFLADLQVDFVIDAIDTIASKVGIIKEAHALGVPMISSMGMGNRCHPEMVRVADIYQTQGCRLARTMRRELRKIGISSQQVVYSLEAPLVPVYPVDAERVPGSTAFVPPVAGMIMAGVAVRTLLHQEEKA